MEDRQVIDSLHNRAVGLYVDGDYAEARRAWEEILASDPREPRALEGIQLIESLVGSGTYPGGLPSGPSFEEALLQVEELLLSDGRYMEALQAAGALDQACPGVPEIEQAARRAMELFEAAPFIEEEIDRARVCFERGSNEECREACERVLMVHPGHREANWLMAATREGAGDAPMPVRSDEDAAARVPLDTCSESWAPSLRNPDLPAAGAAEVISVDAGDEVFDAGESADIEILSGIPELPLAVLPTAPAQEPRPPSSLPGFEPGAGTGPLAEEASGDLDSGPLFEMPGDDPFGIAKSADESGAAALDPAGGSVPVSAPASTRSKAAHSPFADLEAEMGESFGADLADEVRSGAAAGAAAAEEPSIPLSAFDDFAEQGEESPSVPAQAGDLDFDEDFTSFASTAPQAQAPAVPPPAQPSQVSGDPRTAERVAHLLAEARSNIDAGRLTDAIESAARAFAVDPDAAGAQELIDEARRRQQVIDRELEETLDEARRKLDVGELDTAETMFRQVLGVQPAHREAIDALETIARRRKELAPPSSAAMASDSIPLQSVPLARPEEPPKAPPSPPQPEAARPAEGKERVAATAAAAPGKQAARGRLALQVERPWMFAGIAGAVLVAGLAGIFLMIRFLGGGAEPEIAPPPASAPTRAPGPGRAARGPGAAPPSQAAKPSAPRSPRDPAAGVPRNIKSARRLIAEGRLEASQSVLRDLVVANPADRQAAELLASVEAKIEERERLDSVLTGIRSAYRDERYEDALRLLYRLPPDMQTREIERYKENAWYSDAVLYLQGGNCVEAVRCLDEVLQIDPGDAAARRLKEFAKGYIGREKDSTYLRSVDTLRTRPMEAR